MLGLFVSASPVTTSVPECTTQACVDAAKSVKEYIDFNADPCSDFYQYACGAWMESAKIPDDKAFVGTFDTTRDQNTDAIRDLLEGTFDDITKGTECAENDFHYKSQMDLDKQNFQTLQDYYTSCMDVAKIDALGATPIYPSLAKILAQIPDSQDSFTAQHVDQLTDALIEVYRQGQQPLVSISVGADDKRPDENSIQIGQPQLTLPSKEYYTQPETVQIYRDGLIEVMEVMIGSDNPDLAGKAQEANIKLYSAAEIADIVNRVVDFEIKLASISLREDQLVDPLKVYNPMTMDEIQQKYHVINWNKFFGAFVPKGTPVPKDLIVSTPSFFADLTTWFFDQGGVKVQTLKDFFMIKNLKAWLYATDTKTRSMWRRTSAKISSGTFELPLRYRVCVDNVSGSFGEMIGRYFIEHKFGGEKERKQVDAFIDLIHKSWLERLHAVTWLDDKTRNAAIEKVNTIKHKVAYSIVSPDVRSPESLRNYYSPMEINRESFFDNELAITDWAIKKIWSKIGKPVDKEEWFMIPSDVNAYYSRSTNEIAVPSGILQGPFYSYGAPAYLNYGSIGSILGHEFTHAFDSAGRMYNGIGKLEDWWTREAGEHFEEQSQCFIKQYDAFQVDGPNGKKVNVNGQLTLAENLADSGGIAASYQAFQKLWAGNDSATRQKGEYGRLPNIDLSPEALFFTSYARTWCSVARPEAAVQLVYTDAHAPERFRVNGILQNSAEFSRVYKCPLGSPMNPEKKCGIW
ncbi:hypothetical protein BJV82DRAFT_172618 [Fennellomyces sp. T-0311]|nr:hypothetical protein BJV82DRAFT_172618 [Fennellomyces sp. T-0311]